ncbi:UDP-N-acetylglucosamine--N-acetylmuramyl-(pentapeptide) pyrophosphoryl-undecaprenol N-acetylglucosamine transferase, partial [Streptococcus pneumoniae]|nr:UDP-N-acetylglucosamine--N-acetylmuramyl-(pentapeptide) pyrophosphoryl-undecaprenol N-acetylglucosamine transferase [Streptococcus pneumoniae]
KMYSTFEQASSLAKVEHVGAVTKVSDKITPEPDELVDIQTHFNPKLQTVLFVGGSAGARVFNQLVTDHKKELTERYNIINLTGDSSLNELSQNLFRVDYVTNLYQPLMELADIVVTRGGANTIFELLAIAKLHVIVPLGREASRGDQIENAAYFVKKGYAEDLQESDLTLDSLEEKLSHLLSHKEDYQAKMKASKELKSLADFYQLLKKDLS